MFKKVAAVVALSCLFAAPMRAEEEEHWPLGLLTVEAKALMLGVWARAEVDANGAVSQEAWDTAKARCQSSMFYSLELWKMPIEASTVAKKGIFPADAVARGDLALFQARGTTYLAETAFGEPVLYHLSSITMEPTDKGLVIRLFIDGAMFSDAMIPAAGSGFDGMYWGDLTLTPTGPRPMLRMTGSTAAFLKCDYPA